MNLKLINMGMMQMSIQEEEMRPRSSCGAIIQINAVLTPPNNLFSQEASEEYKDDGSGRGLDGKTRRQRIIPPGYKLQGGKVPCISVWAPPPQQ